MKLHVWDTIVEGRRFRAYTRDKAGKKIKSPLSVTSEKIIIYPSNWNYKGMISTTGGTNEQPIEFRNSIKLNGYAIGRLPPLIKKFFVFESELDHADIKIYSKDKELIAFNEYWNRKILSPKGDIFLGKKPVFVGEVIINSENEAKEMDLDFDSLQENEFQIKVARQVPGSIAFERKLNRELPKVLSKKLKTIGIQLIDANFSVRKTELNNSTDTYNNPTIDSQKHSHPVNIQIKNVASSMKKGIFSNPILQFISVIASILSILAFVNSQTDINWKEIVQSILRFFNFASN